MAVNFEFVSAFLCERVLTEASGVSSAIRIVDIFYVPENPPENFRVQFFVMLLLKTMPVPKETKIQISVTLIRPTGQREQLPDPPDQPYLISIFENDPSIPSGFNLNIGLALKGDELGTFLLEFNVDGTPVTRVPFTLRRVPSQQQS
jgi:hypothetical protein